MHNGTQSDLLFSLPFLRVFLLPRRPQTPWFCSEAAALLWNRLESEMLFPLCCCLSLGLLSANVSLRHSTRSVNSVPFNLYLALLSRSNRVSLGRSLQSPYSVCRLCFWLKEKLRLFLRHQTELLYSHSNNFTPCQRCCKCHTGALRDHKGHFV